MSYHGAANVTAGGEKFFRKDELCCLEDSPRLGRCQVVKLEAKHLEAAGTFDGQTLKTFFKKPEL